MTQLGEHTALTEWDDRTRYSGNELVLYNEGIWRAAVRAVATRANIASRPSPESLDWALASRTFGLAVQVTPNQHYRIERDARTGLWVPAEEAQWGGLRTLYSAPITLATPPTATSVVVPLFAYQFVKPGGVEFSTQFGLSLYLPPDGSNITASFGVSIDGLLPAAVPCDLSTTGFISGSVDYALTTPPLMGQILSLSMSGASDMTGGDGTVLTLFLTCEVRETAGLI